MEQTGVKTGGLGVKTGGGRAMPAGYEQTGGTSSFRSMSPVDRHGSGMQAKSLSSLRRYSGIGRQFEGMGNRFMGDYNKTFRPAMERFAEASATSPQWLVDEAAVDSNMAFDESYDVMTRNMGRMGINPNSGRWAGLQQQWGMARAAAEAGAKTRASRQVEEIGYRRLSDVVRTGMGLAGMASNALGSAASIQANTAQAYGSLAHSQAEGAEVSKALARLAQKEGI